MKHLILAAGLALIAAPAFADTTATTQQQAAVTTSAQQQHTYNYSSEEGASSAIETRNTRLHRDAMERSYNAKAAWAGSAHYY
jgi:hypothetical protein